MMRRSRSGKPSHHYGRDCPACDASNLLSEAPSFDIFNSSQQTTTDGGGGNIEEGLRRAGPLR
jgi:hypothetical protein